MAISIHALREEGDGGVTQLSGAMRISIHALREEGDLAFHKAGRSGSAFLSTPSARRATRVAIRGMESNLISIHALREEGDDAATLTLRAQIISIHALREEGDLGVAQGLVIRVDFYPRPPRGGRPVFRPCYAAAIPISIHALREEGDQRGGVGFMLFK